MLPSNIESLLNSVCNSGTLQRLSSMGSTCNLKRKLKACAVVVLLAVVLAHHVALLFLTIIQHNEHSAIRRALACLRVGCSVVVASMMFRRDTSITATKCQLASLYRSFPQLGPPSLRPRRLKVLMWIARLFSFCNVLFASIHSFLPDMNARAREAYFAELWFGLKANRLQPAGADILWAAESVVYTISADVYIFNVAVLYAVCCALFKARLRDFRVSLQWRRFRWAATNCSGFEALCNELRRVERLHSRLAQAAGCFEDLFSPMVFWICVACVADICNNLYNFFDHNLNNFASPTHRVYWLRRWAVYARFGFGVVLFVLFSASAATVNEEGELALSEVERLTLDAEDADTCEAHLRVLSLLSRFSRPYVRLTAWKVFDLTRGFVIRVLGAIVTYGVIVLQFVHFDEPK
ncbi:hypothetical protein HPB49_007734 [Dermacentor silvarum]|uniref:Uncharacterized protein n=1 Tax=Dermacentor silvarum TaxID=543639 RepID=A0ACB8DWL3_DERSI|nr:hypothetical protein HPB49_007734 [Dermacentor silvarum]